MLERNRSLTRTFQRRKLVFQDREKTKLAAELETVNRTLIIQADDKEKKAFELIIANKELLFQNNEKENRALELIIANKELVFQNSEKEKRAAELVIANKELSYQNEEKAKRASELLIANKELRFQSEEKEKRADELIIANKELSFQNEEKAKRASELIVANKELTFQNEEKEKRADELIIANKELSFQNEEKAKRASELIVANKELEFQNCEKENRASELIVANKELYYQKEEKGKRANELIIANKELSFQTKEKAKRASELVIANIELELQNYEKENRASELIVANKELYYQNEEKGKRADELIIANKELSFQTEEKAKRAGELIFANKELLFQKEKAKLQAQLQQSQKLESLGTLAGGVAHDMNNVLGAILGLASTHLVSQPPGTPAYQAFEIISKAAVRGGKLVKSLLTFARQSPAESLQLDLNTIVQEEIRLLECTVLAKVQLEVDLAPGLLPIRGDAAALTHAIMNLCINAVDAMPDPGTLTLRTRNLDNGWVEVLVEDTGTGMSKAVLEKALDPFFTTKDVGKGTGLGLSTVYATMKAHQGQLEILSEPGQGTRVSLRFPGCEPMISAPEPAHEPRPESSQRSLNVFVVDDDEMVQSSMQAILDLLGHTVITARNGEEALAKLEARFEPDLVILDMNMPGLGGGETLPRLRALLPAVPVLLATGRTDQAALELIEAHPYVTLLPKPFSLSEIKQYLGSLERD